MHCTIIAVKAGNGRNKHEISPAEKLIVYNLLMYIVAIAWIYVTLLMALTEPNITAGILTLVLYGLVPLSLFLWLVGTPQRRRNRLAKEMVDQVVSEPDRGNTGSDQ